MTTSVLERLKAGTNNKKTITFPGTEEPIVIHVLSEGERQDAVFSADRHFNGQKIEVSMSTVETFEAEKTLQMIYRAATDADGKPLARTVDEFRKLITLDEKNVLVDEYLSMEKECSPSDETMSNEELARLVDDLKKNPATPGSVSSISIARQLITYLVNLLQSLPKDNGSIS